MESIMYRLTLLIISTIFLASCDGNNEEVFECPTMVDAILIPVVRIKIFDVNNTPLNVCDVILTIDNLANYQTVYGSAFNNCEGRFSLEGGYDSSGVDVFIEKAGFLNQEFKAVLPIATQCSYETLELDVYLEVN